MGVPIVDENEERIFAGEVLDPANGAVIEFFLSHIRIENMINAGIENVLIAARKPHALAKEGIHGARHIAIVVKNFREKGRVAGQFCFSAMGNDAVPQGTLAGKQRRMRGLRGNYRAEHLLGKHTVRRHLVDLGAGLLAVAVTAQVVGALRIECDEDDVHGVLRPF